MRLPYNTPAGVILPAGTTLYSLHSCSENGVPPLGMPNLSKSWRVRRAFKVQSVVKRVNYLNQEWVTWYSWNRGFAVKAEDWNNGDFGLLTKR